MNFLWNNNDTNDDTNKNINSDVLTVGGEKNKIVLKLGDIIEIDSPSNSELNEKMFIIEYIDSSIIILLNVSTLKYNQLNIDDNGHITDESINTIYLLNRSDEEGYARQNGLLPKKWLDIHIGGEFPTIITGEITNLDQDMIEVTTFPDLKVIYIDFAYQGIPRNIPFKKFELRQKPAIIPKDKSLDELQDTDLEEEEENYEEEGKPTMAYSSTGELIIDIPEGSVPDKDITEILDEAFLSAEDIVFGEELEDITQVVELPESQRKYDIEIQANDLMDQLLSTIPNSQRSKDILNKFHEMIERFKQMRNLFSEFDDNGNVIGYKQLGPLHKPLIERLQKLDKKIKWILPVVKQKRVLYGGNGDDDELYEDVIFEDIETELFKTTELFENYKRSNLPSVTNKYENLFTKLNELSNPVPLDKCIDCVASEKEVLTNMDTIINNLGDFYSTTNKASKKEESDNFVKSRFVIQRYNLGANIKAKNILKSGKVVYVNKNMTANDKVNIDSLLLLPEPIVKFSHVDLPGTNIMTKSNLHMNYLSLFRLLKEKTDISTHIVDNLDKEIKYVEYGDDSEGKKEDEPVAEFLSTLKEYSLDESLNNTNDKFSKFLNVIFPKSRLVFRLIRKYIKDKLSFVEIIKELEPFYIYSNDITYQQYNEIRFYIKNKIFELRKKLTEKTIVFRNLRSNIYKMYYENKIKQILLDSKEFFDMFEDAYNMKKSNIDIIPNSELLSKINNIDGSKLLFDIITTMVIKILSNPDILEFIQPAKIDDMSDKVKNNNCTRRRLTKKYTKMNDLRSDNGEKDVFYDNDYDDTPYDLLNSYKTQQKEMEPNVFLEFLTKILIHKHGVSEKESENLATSIIEGKQRVKDGEYAVLEISTPSSESKNSFKDDEDNIENQDFIRREFYRRSKNYWVHDTSIHEEAFLDTNAIFCNISNDCIYNKTNNKCESLSFNKLRITELEKKRMRDEFENRVTESIDKLDEKIKEILKKDFKQVIKIIRLNELQSEKYNNIAYEIGRYTKDETKDIVISPYAKLRDNILSQYDFQKRQSDLVKFVDLFCREPMIDELNEDINWLYCKESNTKILPQSIYKLAHVFISGGNYTTKLDEICRTNGIMSDDGDSIVDKYSGYVLRKIDFVTEEGYTEEGFRIISHEIMEDDLESKLIKVANTTSETNKLAKTTMIFENEKNQIIYNIVYTVCNHIGIPIESIQDFVLRTVDEIMEKNIQSEDIYNKQAALLEKKKGVKPIPYEIYKNRLMFWIIASCILISIQTAVPSFKIKKTVSGCVRSFSGFPLDGGIEDLSGIEYIACVFQKIKSSITPWNSIERLDKKTYISKIRETIEKLILPARSDVNEMYVKKREFMLLYPDEIVPEEHSIERWKLFLPPIIPVGKIQNLQDVSNDFEKELVNLVTKQHRDQRKNLGIIQQKIIKFGYAIIDEINKITKSKDLLLKTSSQIPFVENACCNTGDLIPIEYFIHENPNIKSYIQSVKKHSEIINTYRELCSPFIFHHPEFTGINYANVVSAIRIENIYNAFFYYCNFDNDLPIPEIYRDVCSDKPVGYKKELSILDKIEFMKINGKQFTEENLQQLMVLVRFKNRVELKNPKLSQQIDVIYDLIDYFDRNESQVIDVNFRNHIRSVLNNFRPNQMVEGARPELNKFKNYLAKVNEKMYYAILDFMDKNSNLSDSEFDSFQDWLLNIFQIQNLESDQVEFRDLLYKKIQYVKNFIYFMSKVLPIIIINKKIYNHIPTHWNLSDVHNNDLTNFINDYWKNIKTFFGDDVLYNLLNEIQTKLLDVYLLVRELPIYSPIIKNDHVFNSLFDTETIYFMYTYLLYTVLYEYIVSSESPELLKTDIEKKKKDRRKKIQESTDASLSSESETQYTGDLAEYNEKMQEIEIKIGNQDELKYRVSQLLLVVVDLEKKNISNIMTYKEISKKVNLSKKQEKKRLTDYLGNLPLDEREIEDQFKKYKMGRWNVGLQKGLVQYDEEVYLREREEMEIEEMNFRNTGLDVDELIREENRAITAEYDVEGIDISELGENYMDGEYYSEDRDPDDYE